MAEEQCVRLPVPTNVRSASPSFRYAPQFSAFVLSWA